MLGPHCHQHAWHAWHADLWRLRLPELEEPNEHRAAPPNPEFASFMEELTSPDGGDQTIEKLVGVYRVLVLHRLAAYIDVLLGGSHGVTGEGTLGGRPRIQAPPKAVLGSALRAKWEAEGRDPKAKLTEATAG